MSDIASGGTQTSSSSNSVDQARDAARQAASALSEKATQTTQDLKAEAGNIASQARDRAMTFAEERKSMGADQIDGVAQAVARAADDLKEAAPQAAHYVRSAADGMQRMSKAMREKSLGEMAGMANSFARQQPMLFFGGAVLAGLALSRFLKSSAPASANHGKQNWQNPGSANAYRGPQGTDGEFGSRNSASGLGKNTGVGGNAGLSGSAGGSGSKDLGGSTSLSGSTPGLGGGSSGLGGSASGIGSSTSGQGSSTSGVGGSASGLGGASGIGGSASGKGPTPKTGSGSSDNGRV